MTALKIYKIFLLPYLVKLGNHNHQILMIHYYYINLLGYIKQDNIIENVIFNDSDNNDNNDDSHGGWKISFKSITSIHNEIFSNIKRKDIVDSSTNNNDTSNTDTVISDTSIGFWSWTKAFSNTPIGIFIKIIIINIIIL